MKRMLPSLLFFMLISSMVLGVTCIDYEEKLHWESIIKTPYGGNDVCYDMCWPWVYQGRFNTGLTILNVAAPEAPYIASNLELFFSPTHVWHSDNILLVQGKSADNQRWLASIDVSDPLSPTLNDTMSVDELIYDVSIQNDIVLLTHRSPVLEFLDISNPHNMTLLTTWDSGNTLVSACQYAGQTYLGSLENLIVADVSDPFNPQILNAIPGLAWKMAGFGEYLAVNCDFNFKLFDVSDPVYPVQTSEIVPLSWIRMMDFNNERLVLQSEYYLELFVLSDVGELESSAKFWVDGSFLSSVFLDAERLYTCDIYGVSTSKLGDSQPLSPTTFSSRETGVTPWPINDIKTIGDYAFVAAGENGLIVYDFDTMAEPVVIGSGFAPAHMNIVELKDNLAILAGGTTIAIFDISDPTLPQLISSMEVSTGASAVDMVLHGSTAWISYGWGPLIAVEISNPYAPQEILSMPQEYTQTNLAVSDNLLHVSTNCGNYEIYSLDIMPPVRLSVLELSGWGEDVEVQDNLAFVCSGGNGYFLIDYSDPSAPQIVNQTRVDGNVHGIKLLGSKAIVAAQYRMHLLDISDLMNPRALGTVWKNATSVATLEDGEILMWDDYYDFHVAPVPCSMVSGVHNIPAVNSPNLMVYPNPFNPSTTISFDLPEAASVTLRIYDTAGRLIRTLFSQEDFNSGPHTWSWNGADGRGRSVASGVYFVYMEAGKFRTSGRMALVR